MIDGADFKKWLSIFNVKTGPAGNGDVTGPASATANAIALYSGTTGKLIKNSLVTIDSAGSITLPGIVNLSTTTSAGLGAINQNGIPLLNTYNNNLFLGASAGNFSMNIVAQRNIGIGLSALDVLDTGTDNCIIAYFGGSTITSGAQNTILAGNPSIISGVGNTIIGFTAGSNYTSSESSNILINHPGITGESNVMRLGNSDGSIINSYIAGEFSYIQDNIGIGNNNTFNAGQGVNSCILSGSNNTAAGGANNASAFGLGNTIQAASYGFVCGASNQDLGCTAGFIHGLGNTINAGGQNAILGSDSCTVSNGGLISLIVSSLSSTISGGNTGTTIIAGNTIDAVGDYVISGWLATTTNVGGGYSLVLGKGTFDVDQSVVLTDQANSYVPPTLSQQFYARFTNGIDLNTVTISSTGTLKFNGGSGTNNIEVPNNLADALSINDGFGNTYFTAVSTSATPHALFTQTCRFEAGQIASVTSVTAATYTTTYEDYILACNRASAIAITLIASPTTGRVYRIKDISGAASINNITITPAAGTIDGAANYVINTNYGSIDIVYNGASWSIL